MNAVLDVLSEVEANVGIKASYDKTVLYRIGSIANTNAKCYTKRSIKWSNEPSNTLGIDLHQTNLWKNFEAVLTRMDTVTKMWHYRSLTLVGKVLVLNTLIASLFVYKMTVIPEIPDSMIERIEKCFTNFLWKGAKPKIPLKVLQCSKELGGLGLVDIRVKHKLILAKWVKYAQTDMVIHELANEALDGWCVKDFIWKVNLSKEDISQLQLKESFWKRILSNWCELNFTYPKTEDRIKTQIIWLNSCIKIQNKIRRFNSKFGVIRSFNSKNIVIRRL